MHGSIDPHVLLRNELAQRAESGYDTRLVLDSLAERGGIEAIDERDADEMLDELERAERGAGWSFVEPDDLAGIRAESEWPAPARWRNADRR